MRVYISGPITGTTDYMQRFAEVESYLKTETTFIINPAKTNATLPELTWDEYMALCIPMLDLCDTIYMMPGWEASKGARVELDYAKKHSFKIIDNLSLYSSVCLSPGGKLSTDCIIAEKADDS